MKLTAEEIKKLVDVGIDVKLPTKTGYKKIVQTFEKKDAESYKIYFEHTSFIVANTHKLLLDNEWVNVEDLKVGDIVSGLENSHKIIKIEKLKNQDFIDFEMPDEHYIIDDVIHHNSGKSLIQAIIAMYLAKDGNKSVIIVPNVSLVHQFYSDMEDYFQNAPFKVEDRVHKIYAGQPKHFEYPVTISTWQSLQKSPELFADVKCLIIDEVQKAKNFETVISEMIIPSTINSEYKFGFTGSMPKGRLAELSIVGGLGPVNKIVTAKDLIDMGFGTPMEINLLYLKYSEFMAREIRKYSYQSEKKLFRLLPERNEIIVKLAKNLTQKYGNTLILFETIAHGYDLVKELIDGVFLTKITRKTIKEMIDNLPEKILVNTYSEKEKRIVKKLEEEHNVKINIETLEDNHIFFIYGEIDSKIREEIRHKVEKLEDAIIIANYQTFSTGINIKNLHNLIFASSIKSFETIVQSLGRTIRLKEGKDKVRIFDIIDDCVKGRSKNYGYKHFEERLQIYFDEGHRLKEKRVHMNISYEKFKEYEKEFEIIKK